MKNIMLMALIALSFNVQAAWYKGNTHTHTKLSGHGDTPPTQVAKWYHKRGYNFLVLSEHNRFINPANIKIKNQRKDFLLIGGVEVSGPKAIHTTALNVDRVIPYRFDSKDKSKIVQYHVDQVQAHGGEAILNHPNFRWALSFDNILPVENLKMFELFNGHPHVNNEGDHEHISTEVMWDKLLTEGRRIYGVSSDDAHWFKQRSAEKSNPGRGWVMVESKTLSGDAITEAMRKGRFYSSNGVHLKSLNASIDSYKIEVDEAITLSTIKKGYVVGKKVADETALGTKIQFISSNGVVVHEVQGNKAEIKVNKILQYVRVKVSYTVKNSVGKRQYYAWTQPVFP